MTNCCDATVEVLDGEPTHEQWCDLGWHGCTRQANHHFGPRTRPGKEHRCKCGVTWL